MFFKEDIGGIYGDIRNDKIKLSIEIRKLELVFFYFLFGFKSVRRNYKE